MELSNKDLMNRFERKVILKKNPLDKVKPIDLKAFAKYYSINTDGINFVWKSEKEKMISISKVLSLVVSDYKHLCENEKDVEYLKKGLVLKLLSFNLPYIDSEGAEYFGRFDSKKVEGYLNKQEAKLAKISKRQLRLLRKQVRFNYKRIADSYIDVFYTNRVN